MITHNMNQSNYLPGAVGTLVHVVPFAAADVVDLISGVIASVASVFSVIIMEAVGDSV